MVKLPLRRVRFVMELTFQEFSKYKERGAYHWKELENNLKRYNAGTAARYNISQEIIFRNCKNPRNIVDVGCGDGIFTKRLAGIYKNSAVTGFDFDEMAIQLAVEKTNKLLLFNLSFVYGNAFEYVKKADLIVATDVIEHLCKTDEFMRNCYNALTDKGYLFLSTPLRYREFPDDKYHIQEFFYTELENFSKSYGFSIIEHKSSHDYFFIEKYNKKIKFMGIGKMRLYKYLYNLLAIYFDRNVFEKTECILPTMQYLLLKKP